MKKGNQTHAADPAKVAVELSDVSKTYAGKGEAGAHGVGALRGVSLRIGLGESVAVVGKSGSGKSTLLNLMGALDVPTSGRVSVLGVELGRSNDRVRTNLRRERLGFVFQFFNLIPTLSALENIMMPAILAGKKHAVARELADRRLAEVGLSHRAKHQPYELSGGEMQRVAIARALVLDPALLLADEPTGNLDTDTGESILRLLLGFATPERALVIVTHDPSLAARLQRVVGMRDGQVEYDRKTQLVESRSGLQAAGGPA